MTLAGSPASKAHPLVSLSIVSHGDWGPLTTLLESLAAHEPVDRMQLIVTDNLGTDVPDLAPSGWHSVIMRRPARPQGFAANHNLAFADATGAYFCILNPDLVFTQSAIETLIGHLEGGRGHLAAPVLTDSGGKLQDSFRRLPTPWEIGRRWLGRSAPAPSIESDGLLHPDWIAGMFMLLPSATFSRLGGFDARYRLYFEDVDLCTRLRLAGMSVVVDPTVSLLHDPRRRSRRPGRHLLWHVQSAARFFSSSGYRRARQARRNA